MYIIINCVLFNYYIDYNSIRRTLTGHTESVLYAIYCIRYTYNLYHLRLSNFTLGLDKFTAQLL